MELEDIIRKTKKYSLELREISEVLDCLAAPCVSLRFCFTEVEDFEVPKELASEFIEKLRLSYVKRLEEIIEDLNSIGNDTRGDNPNV
jgi:hypothetical protein